MSDPKNYTVGWICAVSIEYTAAQVFLDKKHKGPGYVSPNDNNDYTLGMIGEHNVVIAASARRDWGLCTAAIVATHMLHSFQNVTIILMVGIGGGVPNGRHDVRLGDIVVGSSRRGKSAVFQYDFGTTRQDQTFLPFEFSMEPPAALQTAVNKLKDQYERGGHKLEDSINSVLEKNPRLQRQYSRPEPSSDRLYHSSVVHPQNDGGCGVFCGNDFSSPVYRHERAENDDNPAIHYGMIASGNQRIKDALFRDSVSYDRDVLCFETEAAGVANHYPALIIRGICDYSDSHKYPQWCGYAAMAAVAYAKEILHQIPSSNTRIEKMTPTAPREPRHRGDIHIAIICALPREADAVKAIFDECWDDTGQQYGRATGDPNAYTIGAIGCHNVVMAHLPAMGETNSASVAAYCKTSFENIHLALVVGVCGAVPFPNDHEEIVLGDVVISHGIIQYAFGKQYPDGFRMRVGPLDTLTRPNIEVQSILAKLKTQDDRKNLQEKTSNYLSTSHDQLSGVATYPGATKDKLYEAAYHHKHRNPFFCKECAERVCAAAIDSSCDQLKCSSTRLVTGRRRNKEGEPAVHFGLIASANTVMKSGRHRDDIAAEQGVIAFEMEGAGAWDHFPCLVIKGVCDYADCHKDKKWQDYAATTAAACTKAFLQYWTARADYDST